MSPKTKSHKIDFGRDVLAILFLAAAIFTALCLFSYNPTDPALNSVSNIEHVRNFGGIVGAYIADILLIVFGMSAYLTPLLFLIASALQFSGKRVNIRLREIIYYCAMVAFAASIIHLRFETISIRGHAIAGGGIVGGLLGGTLERYLNLPGAYVISTAAFFLFFTLATKLSLGEGVTGIKWLFKKSWAGIALTARWVTSTGREYIATGFRKIVIWLKGFGKAFGHRKPKIKKKAAKIQEPRINMPPVRNLASRDRAGDVVTLEPIDLNKRRYQATTTSTLSPKILKRADEMRSKKKSDEQLKFHRMEQGYAAPPLSLLDSPEKGDLRIDEETLKANSMLLSRKLLDFGVEGTVTAIHPGPVITMYEFEPAAGTKVGKVVALQDDLSLTLGGKSVRIIPHLPGKAALGIEIPNSERETVWLKETLSSQQYAKTKTRLPLTLGASADGRPMVTDLTKMPHLLVAGATGSGKSVGINSFILSMIYKASPSDLRLILVDPKMLELSIYDGIPHLLLPVVTKPKPAVQAMRWAIREMERRYRHMADTGTRNILGYNEKIKKGLVNIVSETEAAEKTALDKEAIAHTGKLPYIVIIIDELADLMMVASQEMEESITRLAQMARAAGIHLILATQRPSVDVITGLIKANFPARIAFKVTARHDSRTILDSMGAERLLGSGDMLFMSPEGGGMTRVHGAFMSDSDISRVVAHLKQQGKPIYNEEILKEPENANGSGSPDGEDDELYDKAVSMVSETKQASISMVQRKLRIGYNRAARMIERMEAEGVVGPAEGSKPRQVLISNFE